MYLRAPRHSWTGPMSPWWPRASQREAGRVLTCVVKHPALQTDFRIPFTLNVHFAPVVSIKGIAQNWYVGQENVKFDCGAKANPPARYYTWIRLDGQMPEGVHISNSTFAFTRALDRNDSGVYRCEVMNDIGLRSKDVNLWVQGISIQTVFMVSTDQPRAQFSSPTLAPVPNSTLGTIVGGAVGGVLLLVLLLILGVVCYMRQRRTFRGDYYTKQYLGPSDMQKEAQLDVLQRHELQEVYGDKTSKGNVKQRSLKDPNYYPNHYNNLNMHPCGPPVHSNMNNGSPYVPEDCYDNATDSDYVSHMDGSVISRREWYV
uniref:Ig-like domain-containing protein n=1 Tax=Periophthalmus magnuspinnatus TaxID=409849 RepID=A0A3B4BGL2_9GOBI